jgi:hypothetical protein
MGATRYSWLCKETSYLGWQSRLQARSRYVRNNLGSLRLVMQQMADHHRLSQRPYWCAMVVLVAVCALTVSVTTRFTSSEKSPASAATSVYRHFSPENIRQRLTRDAATWLPPVIASAVLQLPAASPQVAPSGPLTPNSVFATNLYNRPPPAINFLV